MTYSNMTSIAAQMKSLASEFDARIDRIIDSTTDTQRDFRVGRIHASLSESGLDFYQALEVIASIEDQLRPGIETKTISSAIVSELSKSKPDWAREFNIRYGEGTVICLKDATKVPLCTSQVRSSVVAFVTAIGYRWDRQLPEVTRSIVRRCQRLGMPEISAPLLDEIMEAELREQLAGYSLVEFNDNMPSVVAALREETLTMESATRGGEDGPDLFQTAFHICQAILFHFGVIPPASPVDSMVATIHLLDDAKDPRSSVRSTFSLFLTNGNCSHQTWSQVQGKKQPVDFFIDQAKCSLRRLKAVSGDMKSMTLRRFLELEQDSTNLIALMSLMDLCSFIWPEDWLAASTLKELRHSVLRFLYRYRCTSTIKLTRALQVHPKHIARALVPLQRDGHTAIHHVRDGDLVLITPEGELYCEKHLKLKLRCALSSL